LHVTQGVERRRNPIPHAASRPIIRLLFDSKSAVAGKVLDSPIGETAHECHTMSAPNPQDAIMSELSDDKPTAMTARRVIKRYSNRKLYDTRDSRYVTLLEIAELVRAGEDVQVIDNATKEDKTDVTLALIISEELKARPKGIPLATLRSLIFEHGERLLNQLRDVPIKKFVPWESEEAAENEQAVTITSPEQSQVEPTAADGSKKSGPFDAIPTASNTARAIRATFEQWQQAIDERIRTVVPNSTSLSDLEREVKQLSARVTLLEEGVGRTGARSLSRPDTESQE
jgi:polyhydroxyalkanoate synthesis repressor PhaR